MCSPTANTAQVTTKSKDPRHKSSTPWQYPTMAPWRVVGINFDHTHMGDLLRHVVNHENAEIVGICDADTTKMEDAISALGIERALVYSIVDDSIVDECIRETRPDLVILCSATADHASTFEEISRHGVDVLVEKPFPPTCWMPTACSAPWPLQGRVSP
jgi:hypothetical protein